MARSRIRLARAAEHDLGAIRRYLVREVRVERANAVLGRLRRTAETYAKHPLAGRAEDHLEPGLRSFTVPPYVVYYLLEHGRIGIARILHDARDLAAAWQEASRDTDS